MIDAKDLKQFKAAAVSTSPWISICMDVNGASPQAKAYRIRLKDMVKEVHVGRLKGYPPEVGALLDSLVAYVEGTFDRRGARGVCIFASPQVANPFVFRMPVGFPARVFVGDHPLLYPFLPMVETARHLLIAHVQRGKAVFYRAHFGKLEQVEAIEEDLPPKVREGGWKGYSEKKIDRHVEEHLRKFLHRIGEAVALRVRRESPDYLVVIGSAEIFPLLKDQLSPLVPEGRVLFHVGGPQPSWEEMLRVSGEVAAGIRAKEEESLLAQVVLQAPLGKAVTGATATLRALYENQVDTLLLGSTPSGDAFQCPNCGFLGVDAGDCPHCHVPLTASEDLQSRAVYLALTKGARLFHPRNGALDRFQGMAATLRFPV